MVRCNSQAFLWKVTLFMVLPNSMDRGLAAVPQSESHSPAAALRRYKIEPTTAGVLDLLRQWQPSTERRAQIARLIGQLGSDSYPIREAASRRLATLGVAAEAALREATQSDDLEVVFRAHRLLADCQQGQAEDLLMAALQWLRQSPSEQATPLLLDLLPVVPDAFYHAACEALWACVGPGDAKRLRQAIADKRAAVRAAAIPALELAAGAATVNELEHFLRDKEESTRLAAVRALLDRLPQPSIAVLLELLNARDANIRDQAAWLLQQVSGIPPAEAQSADFAAVVQRWNAWAGTTAAQHPQPLGLRRLQAIRYGTILLERFSDEVAEIGRTYHQLQYETNVGGKAVVVHGMLRLDGNHAEGDQRLCATSQRLLGVQTFPQRFQIKANLGGESLDAGAWHVGISAGNIRLLFHPGTEGGQFRAERLDNHQLLMENRLMLFTPAADILHEMIIDVAQGGDGSVRFDAVVVDGAKTGKRFQCSLTVGAKDIGSLGRIGLERSGRTGGAALFGSFSIRNAGLGEKKRIP